VIFIDSNVPMYLVGAEHRHKLDAARLVERAVLNRERLVTDAEVFQEILHRYGAIRRLEAVQPAFDVLHRLADEVVDVTVDVVESAKQILDRGFDGYPGVERLS